MVDVRTPAARSTDPVTSHEAAEHMTKTGKRQAQQAKVLKALKKFPGRTSAELAGRAKLDRYMVARRLPELVTGLKAKRGDVRQCRKGGRNAVTWYPV